MSIDPIPSRIFVGNFDYETTESEILFAFQVCGRVADVNIIRKSFSDFYGFVTFMSPDAVDDALDGRYDFYIRGRRLRVRRAYLKSPKTSITVHGLDVQFVPDGNPASYPQLPIGAFNDVIAAFNRQLYISTPACSPTAYVPNVTE